MEQDVFVFDPLRDYPEFPLSLNDVAEVSFVKLGGEDDGVYIQEIWNAGASIDPEKERLFCPTMYSGLMEYDINGRFLRKIGNTGRGPGEYIFSFFCIYPEKEQIWIHDFSKDKFLVFGYDGSFLPDEGMDASISPGFYKFMIQENCVVAYSPESITYNESAEKTVIRSEKTLELFPLDKLDDRTIQDLHYEKPLVSPKNWPGRSIMMGGHLFPSYSGLMLTTYRSDTTYVIEKDFAWRPFLVNEKHNGVQEGCLYPAGETKDYLFLCHQNNLKDGDMFYFAIDKKTKQAYKITEDESNPLPGPLQGKAQIRYRGIMKHPQYRFWEFDGVKLKKQCYDYLPPDLKVLVDQCDEESNPILMLIKFKE